MTAAEWAVLREAVVPGCAVCRSRHTAMLYAAGDFAGVAHRRAKATASGAIERFDVLLATSRTERDKARRALAYHLRTEHDVSLDVTT